MTKEGAGWKTGADGKVVMEDEELLRIYDFAVWLGREAGLMLMQGVEKRCGEEAGRDQKQVDKESAVDIVTQTDLDVEAFVKSEINRRYPSHEFIGEETYSKGASRQYFVTNAPTWIVDPLDGTVNYTHLFPMFCISIALCINGSPTIGVIHAPVLETTYSALSGHGSYLHDSTPSSPAPSHKKCQRLPLVRTPVPPLEKRAPAGCVFSCEWGKDRRDAPEGNMHRKVESFVNMAAEIGGRGGKGGMVHGVRSLGSATLDLAFVATGAFDIWWEGGCWEWDVAAGICILKEAGGLVTTANPPLDLMTAKVEDVRLGSRLYLAIRYVIFESGWLPPVRSEANTDRPAGDAEGETGRQAQERVVREVWRRVSKLDYARPGA